MFLTIILSTLIGQSEPEIVRFASGELATGYELDRGCHAPDQCADLIRDTSTGTIIMYQGQWITGYEPTGRGQEVVKLPQEPEMPPQ